MQSNLVKHKFNSVTMTNIDWILTLGLVHRIQSNLLNHEFNRATLDKYSFELTLGLVH